MATATLTVQHGRRKGTTKDTCQDESQEADQLDPRQIAVVTGNEWQRIKYSLTRQQHEEERVCQERTERLQRHQISKNIVKNWENTIEGQRQKKLQAKRLREEKEEEEKKKIDIEEAQYQAQKRKEAIEHAKTLQYYQTDRVKGFHGALLLTEVLRERDAQVDYKKRKQEAAKGRDHVSLQMAREDYERGLLDDQEQATKRLAARKTVATIHAEQMQERLDMAERMKHEDQVEGQAIQQDVSEFHRKQQGLEEKKHQEKIELNQTLQGILEQRKELEAMKKRDDEDQEEEIQLFVQAKKKMTRMRKEQERALFKQFRDHQEKMANQLAKQMQTKVDDEDKRIAQAVKEADEKRTLELKAKGKWHMEQQKAIHEHRTEMMAENERKEKDEEDRDIEMLKQRVELDMKFKQETINKEKKRRDKAKELSSFRFEQLDQHYAVEDKLCAEQMEFDKEEAEALKAEEEQFQTYAVAVLKEAEENKSCVAPLKAAIRAGAGGGRGPPFDGLGGLRPSFQAMDNTGVQLPSYCKQRRRVQGRPSDQPGSTRKRMGFTW